MVDLSKIGKRLIHDYADFESWMINIPVQTEPVGFDIETNGEDYPNTKLAGFSLYSRQLNKVCYVPINHVSDVGETGTEYCLELNEIRDNLQRIFDNYIMVTHNGLYDYIVMNKLGFKFYSAIDTYLLSVALQFQNLGLKDLALEFGLAKFGDVISYKKLMVKLGFPEDHVDFTKVNIFKSREAFEYAINDPIFAFHLAEVLYQQYTDLIGETAGLNMAAQTDTMLFLCESSASGFYINKECLDNFITQYEKETNDLDLKLKSQVRKRMGWGVQNEII